MEARQACHVGRLGQAYCAVAWAVCGRVARRVAILRAAILRGVPWHRSVLLSNVILGISIAIAQGAQNTWSGHIVLRIYE